MSKAQRIQDAIAALQDATSKVYNIEGQLFQLSYEVLEAIIANIQTELSKENEVTK